MMRFLRFFPGLWINLFGLTAITALVMLALVLDRLSGFFQAEWPSGPRCWSSPLGSSCYGPGSGSKGRR